MNKRILCAALGALLAVARPAVAPAQNGATADYWDGNVIGAEFIPENLAADNLFLYNVGTGLWLYIGGDWGTRATLSSIGKPLTFAVHKNADYTKYGVTASFKNDGGNGQGNNLGMVLTGDDIGKAYWDRAFSENGDQNATFWKFELVDEKNRRYAFSASRSLANSEAFYLTAEDNTINTYGHIMTVTTETKPGSTDLNGLWKIVTRADLINDFNNTYTRSGEPSNASFLLRAENFNVKNSNVETFWSKTGSLNDTIGAGGYDGTGKKDINIAFRRYYNLGITNAKKGSTYQQEITMEQKGWYRIDCQGLYSMAAGANTAAAPVLFATVADENGNYTDAGFSKAYSAYTTLRHADNPSSPLPGKDELPSEVKEQLAANNVPELTTGNVAHNQLLAGISFYPNKANGFKGSYTNELAFCVPADRRKVKVGIYFPEAQGSGDHVFADIFQVKYLGEDFVITEDALPEDHNNYSNRMLVMGDSYNPSQNKHARQKRRTLILKRHFDEGVWNSIVLPISLTKAQVANAFGSDAQLAKLDQLTDGGYTIHFNYVDLSEKVAAKDVVFEAGKIYLIKPTRRPLEGPYAALDQTADGKSTELSGKDKFYVIDRMSLGYEEDATDEEDGLREISIADPEIYPADNDFGNLRFTASYNMVGVDAGSYVFSKGNLYHLQNRMLMKGLRGYVSLVDEANAPQLTVCIDGVDETTGISGISISDAGSTGSTESEEVYYRLDGTRAGQLSRGLYIAKGRKILVK